MSAKDYKKRWQRANLDRYKAYTAKYLVGKTRVSVTLDDWVAEEVAKIKPSDQPLGGWIREKLTKWAEESKLQSPRQSENPF